MPIFCPNINLKSYKDLELALDSKSKAYALWVAFDGVVPEQYYKKQSVSKKQQQLEQLRKEKEGLTTLFNNIKLNRPQLKNVKNQYIKPALIINKEGEFYIPQVDTANKKYIVNKYFRMKDGTPFYPFTTGVPDLDNKLRDTINADMKSYSVKYDQAKGVLEFGHEVEMGISTKEQLDIMMSELDISKEDFDILPEEDMLTVVNKQNQAFEEVIERYQKMKRVLNRRLTEKSGNYASIKARIDNLDKKIDYIRIEQNNTVLPLQARIDATEIKNNLEDIEANLYKDLNEDQLAEVMNNLREQHMYIKGWKDILEFTNAARLEDKEFKKQLRIISGDFDGLNNRYNNAVKEAFVQYANKTSFRNNFDEIELLKAQLDEGTISRFTLGAHMSNNEIIQIMDDIIDQAKNRIHNETLDRRNKLIKKIEGLKKHLNIKDEVKISEIFHQLDSKGKWTGGLINKIDQTYFDEVKRLAELAKKDNSKRKDYYSFLDKNTFVITKKEFEAWMKSDKSKSISTQKYSNGEYVFTKEDFEKQEELYNRYLDLREAEIDRMVKSEQYGVIAGDNISNFEFADQQLKDNFLLDLDMWDKLNNPFYSKNKIAYGNKNLLMPKPDSKWFDKRFKRIENDPVLMDFYKFYKENIAENDKYLPYYEKVQSNYFAASSISTIQELMRDPSIVKGIKAAGLSVLDAFREEIGVEFENLAVGGEVYKGIPVGLLHIDIPSDKKNPNIFTGLMQHMDLATSFKYKSQVEPVLNIAKELTEQVVNQTTGASGGLVNTIKRAEYMLDAFLYGEKQVDETKEHRNKVRKKLEDKLRAEGKTEDEIKLAIKEVESKKKIFSWPKSIDALIKLTYLRQMSIPNVISPTLNLGIGTISNYTYASSRKGLDSDLTKAYWMIKNTILNSDANKTNKENAKKILTWLSRLNIIPELNEVNYGDSNNFEKGLTILQSKTEFINQGALIVSQLLNYKLIDKSGNEVSVFDAYNVEESNLVWNTTRMGEQSIVNNTQIFSSDKKGLNMYRFGRLLKGINAEVHGDYTKVLEMKKNALGRALALYKTWIPQTIVGRFGRERFDPQTLQEFKGRYKSLYSITTTEGIELKVKEIIPLLLKGLISKKGLESLSELDKKNMLRNIRELKIMVSLLATGLLLQALSDDDDDELMRTSMLFSLNIINRLQGDMQFYFDPSNMWQILNNPVPIIGTLSDILAIADAVGKTIAGDPYYQSGPWRDTSRVGVSLMRAFPVSNGAVKVYNYASKQYDFNNIY